MRSSTTFSPRPMRNSASWAFLIICSLISSVFLSNCLCFIFYVFRLVNQHYSDEQADSLVTLNTTSETRLLASSGSFLDETLWTTYSSSRSESGLYHADYPSLDAGDHPCTMETCFDFHRCTNGFKVFVYPSRVGYARFSSTYAKILSALARYKWLTQDPSEACLFVPSLDTLDRDPLSPGFQRFVHQDLVALPYWYRLPRTRSGENPSKVAVVVAGQETEAPHTPGLNHLLFNLYAGTWPNYQEDGYWLMLGKAMLSKASFSTTNIRSKFDISLPLVHPQHAELNGLHSLLPPSESSAVRMRAFVRRPILLSFKGKRYVTGIGSASRNALFHLHNGRDIIMVTTCRHGQDWMRYADTRCPIDMALYDRYDYNDLMRNSTFCLIPRGRRLGSYRFLEALQASCIPVMLSNDWELPFSEVIDWRRAVIWADERLLLTVPLMLRRISDHQIMKLRQQVTFLWNTYFQSIETIVFTTLEIIRDRVVTQARSYTIWNSSPGGLVFSQPQSVEECMVPMAQLPSYCKPQLSAGFSVVIPFSQSMCLLQLNESRIFVNVPVFQAPSLKKVILVWMCPSTLLPSTATWQAQFDRGFGITFELVVPDEPRAPNWPLGENALPPPSVRFQPFSEIPTTAVFALSTSHMSSITVKQIEFAYRLWQQFPHRLVGFDSASHRWSHSSGLWEYATIGANGTYSMLLLHAAFYHRHYHYLYWQLVPTPSHEIVNTFGDCEDILLNVLIGFLTKSPPISVMLRSETNAAKSSNDLHWNTTQVRSACLQAFAEHMTAQSVASIHWPSREELELEPGVVRRVGQQQSFLPLYRTSLKIDPTVSEKSTG